MPRTKTQIDKSVLYLKIGKAVCDLVDESGALVKPKRKPRKLKRKRKKEVEEPKKIKKIKKDRPAPELEEDEESE